MPTENYIENMTEAEFIKYHKLDAEEARLLHETENDPVFLRQFRQAAKRHKALLAQKEQSITLRVNGEDLSKFKEVATNAGFKYQTYLSALIHQVAKGKIKVRM